MNKLFLILLTLTTYYLLPATVPAAQAQQFSLEVSPPLIQITVDKPPVSFNTPIAIQNTSDNPVTLQIILKPFKSAKTEDGRIDLQTGTTDPRYKALFGHLQLSDSGHTVTEVKLSPGQQKQIVLHVGLPKDEAPAEYYFTILFLKTSDNPDTSTPLSEVNGAIGTNVLLSVGPKGPAKGSIEEFSAPWYLQNGPVPFVVRVSNQSDHVIAPQGEILVTNMYGQRIGKVTMLPVNILSQTIRSMPDKDMTWDLIRDSGQARMTGDPKSSAPRAIWNEQFLLGFYKADLTIKLSDSGPILRKTLYFIAFPLQGLVGILTLVAIGIFLYVRVKKKLKQNQNTPTHN